MPSCVLCVKLGVSKWIVWVGCGTPEGTNPNVCARGSGSEPAGSEPERFRLALGWRSDRSELAQN